MYDIPSRADVLKVVITAETVNERVSPTLVTKQVAPAKRERREKSA
jgi:ATP-dependent Clp protease ATP-binding subunit ClpX